jgi:ribosomal protein S18 acetylase RimI-like enzyme
MNTDRADSPGRVEIRAFSMEAYDRVLALWQQCEGIGLSQADSTQAIQAYLQHNPGMSLIACVGDTVVGAILCGHDGRRGAIYHLAVAPRYRRHGVGRTLVERCLDSLKQAGIDKCHIFIFNDNQAGIAFWRAMGWTPRSDIGVISKDLGPAVP